MPGERYGGAAANPRAALVAMIAATGSSPAGLKLCAMLLDEAAKIVLAAPDGLLADADAAIDGIGRLATLAMLNEVCAGCRACSRGQAFAGEQADRGEVPRRWRR